MHPDIKLMITGVTLISIVMIFITYLVIGEYNSKIEITSVSYSEKEKVIKTIESVEADATINLGKISIMDSKKLSKDQLENKENLSINVDIKYSDGSTESKTVESVSDLKSDQFKIGSVIIIENPGYYADVTFNKIDKKGNLKSESKNEQFILKSKRINKGDVYTKEKYEFQSDDLRTSTIIKSGSITDIELQVTTTWRTTTNGHSRETYQIN